MAIAPRGEINAELDGRPMTLCLTLGALAELEATLGADDLLSLAERLGRGRLTAREITAIIGAGLRGAGHAVSDADVAAMRVAGGAAGYVAIVARLIGATFAEGGPAEASSRPGAHEGAAATQPRPFPGRS
jgi:hypothetical protein